MSGLRYPIEMVKGVPVVVAPQEIDAHNADCLRAVLLQAAARGHATFVVDMTGTQFCASAGLSVLVRAHKRALADGGELRLVIPASAAQSCASSRSPASTASSPTSPICRRPWNRHLPPRPAQGAASPHRECAPARTGCRPMPAPERARPDPDLSHLCSWRQFRSGGCARRGRVPAAVHPCMPREAPRAGPTLARGRPGAAPRTDRVTPGALRCDRARGTFLPGHRRPSSAGRPAARLPMWTHPTMRCGTRRLASGSTSGSCTRWPVSWDLPPIRYRWLRRPGLRHRGAAHWTACAISRRPAPGSGS